MFYKLILKSLNQKSNITWVFFGKTKISSSDVTNFTTLSILRTLQTNFTILSFNISELNISILLKIIW